MTTTCPKTLPKPVLPSLPTVILRLIEATDDEKKSVKELADLASKDPALSTQILKIANSALINPGKPVKTITQAALNLGLSTLRHVAITAAVCQTLSNLEVPNGFSLSSFWNHSLCCALLCKEITRLFDQIFSEEEAFLAGLLHDIGQLSLVMEMPDAFDNIVQDPRTGQTVLDSETKIWGRDHTVEGFELLGRWRLPLAIRSAARFHHEDIHQIADSIPFLKVVYLGDICAHFIQGESALSMSELVDIFRLLGLTVTSKQLDLVFNHVRNSLEKTAQELGIEIKTDDKHRLLEKKESFALLKGKSLDLATLIGALESLLSAKTLQELHEALFTSIANLTEIQSAVLFHYSDNCLRGVCARGTEDDSLAPQIHILNIEDSIWSQVFIDGKPIFSRDFFQKKTYRTIDIQLKDYLGGEFIAVALKAGPDKIGALALKATEEQWQSIQPGLDIINILARKVAHVLRGISYRQLWEKEHVLNELLVRRIPIGIIITDNRGQILFVNDHSRNLLSLDSRLLKEGNISKFLDIDFPAIINEVPSDGRTKRLGRKKILGSDGSMHWVEVQVALFPLAGGQKFLFFLRDITDSVTLEAERKQRTLWLEKELVKKTQELKRAQEKLIQTERMGAASEVARKVVHEVNNPLGIIKNLLKILKIQKETGKIEDKTIDAIGSEIDRVARIIQKLGDFSRQKDESIDHGQKPRTQIGRVLSELELLVKPGLSDKQISVKTEIEDNLPSVAISEDELKQVLINLFKNAQEAIKKKGEIYVKAYRDGDFVVVEFGDTGPGIPEDLKKHIFSPFVTTKGEKNSGLGLSVCYGLLKACGGEIVLADRDGFGAFFIIRIPVASRTD